MVRSFTIFIAALILPGATNSVLVARSTSGIRFNRRNPRFVFGGTELSNPFNPSTKIQFQLARQTHVILRIFDNLGQEVATLADEAHPAGTYEVNWNASGIGRSVFLPT